MIDRFPRRSLLIGGPYHHQSVPLPYPAHLPEPQWRCHATADGPWHHYARTAPGVYRYAGQCSPANHGDGPLPHHLGCCCASPDCDGTAPWPHPENP